MTHDEFSKKFLNRGLIAWLDKKMARMAYLLYYDWTY